MLRVSRENLLAELPRQYEFCIVPAIKDVVAMAGNIVNRALRRFVEAGRRRLAPPAAGPSFRGAFASYAEAMAAVRPGALAGYDHAEIADVSFEKMCQRTLWDYPIMFWLARVTPGATSLVDAGGHMGTKFRAFAHELSLPTPFEWAVYDVPEIARAGRARAERDGLSGLTFYDQLEATPPTDVLLCSGLLQYIDIPFTTFLQRLPKLPRHLLLNKVATREGPTVVTLEAFGMAEVPDQVRNHGEFLQTLGALGYVIEDSWTIPPLAHTHPAFGTSTSRGFYARLSS